MRRIMSAALAWSMFWSIATAEASSPSFGAMIPRGAERGTETEVHVNGARIGDAVELLFYNSTIVVKSLQAVNDNQLKVVLSIPADARLGEHDARVRTKSGISELKTFFVGPFPAVAEVEPNSEFDKPQPIGMNVTVAGVITSEDVDFRRRSQKRAADHRRGGGNASCDSAF